MNTTNDDAPEPGPASLSETLASGGRIVRRGREELGAVRLDTETAGWQAWDVHGIRRVDAADTPEEAARLLVAGIDRRAAAAAERDAWAAEESKKWEPEVLLPSGRYGVKRVDRGYGPSLQVVQRFTDSGRWGATPGTWGVETLAGHRGTTLALDYGAGWALDEADTAALVALAVGILTSSR